jgi:alpha-1,3-rhamnosyl/mannosyltransferase
MHAVAKQAAHIITVSEFQRQEIIDLLDVKTEKISVVYLGVEPKFKVYSEAACKATLDKYNLQYKHYSLVVSTIEPRKNSLRLLEAFESLPKEVRLSYPLVIVGDKGWRSADIHKRITQLVKKEEAMHLGYVDEQDIPMLYSAALVFLYPSLYEGFGLPILEAMASGTTVLSSNRTSMPEVAGKACLLVDPYSVQEISDGWQRLLEDKVLRTKLVDAGLKRSKMFSWQQCMMIPSSMIQLYKANASFSQSSS